LVDQLIETSEKAAAQQTKEWNQALVDQLIEGSGKAATTIATRTRTESGMNWEPRPINWNNPWYIPGISPWSQYQYGGVVPGPTGQPQLAVVHGGETINPPGQGMSAPIFLKTQINVDGRKVAESTDYLLGDRYYQASRACHGTGGGLISI